MAYLQLLRKVYSLPVGTDQILQDQMIVNTSDIVLFYEDHCQLWNIDSRKRKYISNKSESIYFWTCSTPLNDTKFAFISLENCEPYLGTFNFQNNKVQRVCDLPREQQNFSQLFYFVSTKQFGIQSRGKQHRLLVCNGLEMSERKIDQVYMINQYNKNGVAMYSSLGKTYSFEILKDGELKKYNLNGIEDGSIQVIKQYSPKEAIVGVVHNCKTSSIVLYSLASGSSMRSIKMDFPIDNLIKLADVWVGMCTTEQENNSSVKVQGCFIQGNCKPQVCEINKWIRKWNDYIPIVTFGYEQADEKSYTARVQVVRCSSKKSTYILMMEGLGIIDKYGQEIVKSTLQYFR